MAIWFETSICYDKVMENGGVKKVTEKYLFDALSFTEAEERTIAELAPFVSGEFTIKTNKKTKIAEIFNMNGGERNYLVKVAYITMNEKTGEEKKTISQILVGADNFEDALDKFKEGMKGTIADYEIASIAETPILEVYGADVFNVRANK